MTGMMAHVKTELWLTLTGQMAHFGADYSTVKQRMEAGARLFIGYILIMVFWNIHKQEYAGVLMMSISEIIISMLIGKEIYKNYEERSC